MPSIAHVTATFPPYQGGTGSVAYQNASLAAGRGHDVTVLTGQQPNGAASLELPFRVEYLPAWLRLGNAPFTPALPSRLQRFDLIHLHCPYIFGAELTAMAAGVYHIPLLITYHNDLVASGIRGRLFSRYMMFNVRVTLPRAQRILATSMDYARHSSLGPLLDQAFDVEELPNGVDASVFSPGTDDAHLLLRAGLGIPDGTSMALFVGAMDRAHFFKGVPVLLDAVSRLPETHLVLVGDGDLRAGFEGLGERMLGRRIHFVGSVPLETLVSLYRMADVTVLPSVTQGEAFGMVLLESLACGTPVVASDLPGVRSVVSPGIDGLCVSPNDSNALGDAVLAITGSSDLARRMGAAGREKVLSRFTWDVVGERLERVYSEVLSSHGTASTRWPSKGSGYL